MVKHSIEDIYTDYYLQQAGSGFGNVYSGPIYQKGHGIGSFLGGLFRSLYPILKNGSSALGSELLKSGANVISDIVNNQDPQSVIKKRGKESINNLSRMFGDTMFGAGYKTNAAMKRRYSGTSKRTVKKRKTNKNTTKKTSKKAKSKPKPKAKPKVKRSKKVPRSKSEIYDIFS